MLDPPPRTLPIDIGSARLLICGLGSLENAQSRSLPRFVGHRAGIMTDGDASGGPASSRSTDTSGFSASLRATTEPDDPAPHTMKSYSAASAEYASRSTSLATASASVDVLGRNGVVIADRLSLPCFSVRRRGCA